MFEPDERREEFSGESFEAARPVPVARELENAAGSEALQPAPASVPSLETAIARVPAGTQRLLEELFKAKFTAVRRIDPAKLR